MFPRRKCSAPAHKKEPEPRTNLSNDRMIVERLPARILLSADLPGLDIVALDTISPSDAELQQRLRAALLNHQSTVDVVDQNFTDSLDLDDDVAVSRVLVVVDPQVNNYQQLIADITNTAAQNTELTILVLEPGQDGLGQISKQLSTLDDIAAVHLFSHSSSSGITLGDDQLSLANLADNTAQLELWKSSLSDDADILIYGCDLAGSSDGQALIEQISLLTGADVAASDNTTGTAAAGGDWELEYRTGEINNDVPISLAMQDNYASVLGTFTVLNINDSGAGSLREAITNANAAVGADTIEFNIAGGGPHVIALSSALPSITDEVFIDGTTEPDFINNGSKPIVVIDGNGLSVDGIDITSTADNSEVRGLVIRDFGDTAINIDSGADNVVIAGNFLGGLDTDGDAAAGESIGATIVYVEGGNAVIGGNTSADRNVIAGGADGVVVAGLQAGGTQVSGNYIGVDETGNSVVTIDFDGVRVETGAANVTVGGATIEHGNLIAGVNDDGIHIESGNADFATVQNNVIGVSASGLINLGVGNAGIYLQNSPDNITIIDNLIAGAAVTGIEVGGSSDATIIQGNVIGTDATLTYNWGSGENGILLANGAINSVVGGTAVGQGNVVAFSGASSSVNNAGIAIQDTSTGNTVQGNSIYGSRGAGIDLSLVADDGVDTNDDGDVDTGGNNKQNSAVLSTAEISGAGDFTYDIDTSTLNGGTYTIDFYASDDLDGGEVEGKRYLTSTTVAGGSSATATLSSVVLTPGEYVTLTATDAVGNTSEFSNYAVAKSSTVGGESPDDLSVTTSSTGGLSINQDGGDDVYLQADDGGALLGGLTSFTIETQLTLDSSPSFPHVLDYAVPGEEQELSLLLSSDTVRLSLGGTSGGFVGTYAQLRDGEAHTLSVSWDGSSGDLKLYIDGAYQETITGFQSGYTVVGGGTLVVGNDQDTPGALFQTNQSVHGTLFDIRVFDQVRTDTEILANYDSTLPYDETGMLANWTFDALSTYGVLTDSVASNNLTLLHIAEPGFTASSAALVLNVNENAVNGTVVGNVTGSDPEREALIATLLANNTDLYYNAETEKFYQHADDSIWRNWTASRDNAMASTLNGVSGQLVTIDSATENQQVVDILNAFGTTQAYILASDAATEGEWRQGDLDSDRLFWEGAGTGYSVNDSYANWDASNPNNFSGSQNYAKMFAANGLWDDVSGASFHGSVIEYDANAVLGNAGPIDQQPLSYSIIGQSIGGAFTIDPNVGTISVADATSLDYESLTDHVVTVRVTDVDGNTYDEAFTISLRNLTETNNALTNLSSGIELNADGGNDAYLIAGDGGAILGDATKFTVEINFSTQSSAQANLISYLGGDARNDLQIVLETDGTASIMIDNVAVTGLSGIDYNTLRDGDIHHFALSWDNTNGDWFIYVDGDLADSGTGLSSAELLNGSTGAGSLVFGQEQDVLGGGFNSNQIFSGTLYDVRIWNELRSETEILLTYQNKFDTASLPSGLTANWQMDGFNGSNEVVDVVSGNNLSTGHAIGTGFINSTPVADLNVDENSADGISVGFVVPSTTHVVNDLVRDGSFLEATDPPLILETYFEDGSGAGSVVGAWTVTKESVDLISIDNAQSPLGGRFIELDGNDPGGISQTLSTEVGQQYQVMFVMSGDFGSGDEFKQVRVSAAGTSEDYVMSEPSGWVWGDPAFFETNSFTFVADSTSTTLSLESLGSAGNAWGPMIGDVQVLEIPQSVQTILNNDPTLSYDGVTDKFYKVVTTTTDVTTAMNNANANQINGVGGQLVTIRSPYEQELVRELSGYSSSFFYMGATDATVDGEWNWIEDGVEADRFWNGGVAGSAPAGAYANFVGEPGGATGENYALIRPSDGVWLDVSGLGNDGYIIEWDASDVLSNFTFSLTDDAGGRFAIDSNSGEVTVADGSLIDYETATTHSVDVQVTDAAGSEYSEAMTVQVDNGLEPVQTVPGAQTVNEDQVLTFNTTNGNAVSVSDTTTANTPMRVTLSVNDGVLTLSQTTGITFIEGANGSGSLVIDGAESDLNNALDNMTFTSNAAFNGAVNLQMSTTLGSDLAGNYTFDGGNADDQSAGVTDHGSLGGDATTVIDAERGEVLSLDGAGDYVDIPTIFGPPVDATLSAWVKFTSVNATGGDVINLSNTLTLVVDRPGEGVVASYWDGTSNHDLQSNIYLNDGEWHHVAYTFDDTLNRQVLYIDGVAVLDGNETTSMVTNTSNTRIGGHVLGTFPSRDFNGQIDDARIYTRALSSDEISALALDQTGVADSVVITVNATNDAPTFAVADGEAINSISAGSDSGIAGLELPNGQLMVLGLDGTEPILTRFDADGTIDTSFGTSGTAGSGLDFSQLNNELVQQADGKFLASGRDSVSGDVVVVRFNTDGSLDNSFGGGNGVANVFTNASSTTDVALQSDGKIIVGAGSPSGQGGTSTNYMISRLNTDGSVDSAFASGAVQAYADFGDIDNFRELTVTSTDEIVVIGDASNGARYEFGVARFTAEGVLDTSFSGDGLSNLPFTDPSTHYRPSDIVIQADGKTIVAGHAFPFPNDYQVVVARYNTDGSLDTTFGGNGTGFRVTDFNVGNNDSATDIKLNADGSFLLAVINNNDFTIAKYTAAGVPDSTFGTSGILTEDLGGIENFNELILRSDGSFVGVGEKDGDTGLVGYNADGTRDMRFGPETTLDGNPTFVEGVAAVVLDGNVEIFDQELSGVDDFDGATLTLARNGGSDAQDQYSAVGTLVTLNQGANNLVVGATTIGSVTQNSGGTLVLSFNSNATNALVNEAMQQIAYSNGSDTPSPSVQIDWTFDDGGDSVITQGGAALQAVGSTTVNIQNAADLNITAPATSTTNEDTAFVYSGGNVISVDDGIVADTPIRVTLSVSNGTLKLASLTGITFVEGGDGSSAMVIDGLESSINVALNGLEFTPHANYSGADTLNITTALAANLTGHYTFDGATANDSSAGTTHDGSLNGNATTVIDGTRGEVLSLDGSADFVQITGLLGEPANVTLAAWINTASVDVSGAVVISMGESPALYLEPDGTLTGFYESGGTNYVITSAESLTGTGWRHVALTIDTVTQELTVFIDGSAIETIVAPAAIEYDNSPDTYIGRGGTGGLGFDFNGMIDDARIYSRALSADEIAALATDQTAATDSVAITVDPVNDAPSFEVPGQSVFTAGSSGYNQNVDTYVLPDGSMLITPYDTGGDSVLVKLNADGSIDTSFGVSGYADNASIGYIQSVTVDASGNILVAGSSISGNAYLARYDSGGTLDTGFGTSGVATITTASNDGITDIAIQSDGRIVVVGENGDDSLIARFLATGVLDLSFDTDGIVTVNLGATFESLESVTIDSIGNIIAAGETSIIRLADDGSFDVTFDTDGILNVGNNVEAVALQADGQIVAVGGDGTNFYISRYNADGTAHSSFGTGGTTTWSHATDNSTAMAIVQQADGKLVAAGHTTDYPYDWVSVRFNTDGTLDSSFGTGGAWSMTGSTDISQAYSVSLYNDGTTERIIIGGFSTNLSGSAEATVVRLNSNGELDATLGTNTLDGNPTFTEGGAAVVLDADVQVFDEELSALNGGNGNYDGASVTLARNGGASTDDIFSATGTLAVLNQGANNLVVGATTIGSVTTNSGGTLVLTFNSNATTVLVNEAMQQIAYNNNSDAPPANVQIDWSFDDGGNSVNPQGGAALQVSGSTTVDITAVNDDPVVTFGGGNITYVENAAAIFIDASATVTDADLADFNGGVLSISITANGSGSDRIRINNEGMSAGEVGMTTGPNEVYYGGLLIGTWSGSGAPLSITFNASADAAAVEAVAQNITFENLSDDPSTLTRTVQFLLTDGDGGTSTAISKSIDVTPLNDAPVITSDGGAATASINADENQTAVTTVVATDADAGDVPAFFITGGTDAALFDIDLNSGVLTFNTAPDFETFTDANTDGIYEVEVRADDGNTGTDVQLISVTVSNVNEVPTLVSISNSAVIENTDTSSGLSVGTLTSTDVDAGDTFTYSIIGGVDAGVFSIGGVGSDELILTDGVLDFETQPSYAVTVRTTDSGGLTFDQALVITVTDVNEAPSVTSSNTFTAAESQTAVDTVTSSDVDGGVPQYTIVGVVDDGLFGIDINTGVLTFNTAPDFEAPTDTGSDNVYDITVQVDDQNGGIATQNIAITVVNVNQLTAVDDSITTNQDTPLVFDPTANDTDDDGGVIDTVEFTQPANGTVIDNGDGTLTYTPTGGFSGSDSFEYVAINADANLQHHWALNGDAVDVVGSANGTLTGTNTVAGNFGNALNFDEVGDYVTVPDIAYGSEFTISFDFKVDEINGSLFQYLYSHGDVNSANSINVFINEDTHGTDPNVLRTVVRDSNDTLDNTALQVDISSMVGDSQWHTYTLTSGPAGLEVFIDGVSANTDATRGTDGVNPAGSLYLGARQDIDLDRLFGGELDSVQIFSTALDALEVQNFYANQHHGTVNITVNDVPDFSSSTSFGTSENSTAVGTITSVDVDGGAPLYTLVGAIDDGLFSLDINTGVLAFNTAPDFEVPADVGVDNVYNITVQVNDQNGATATQNIAITVGDVNEIPTLVAISNSAVAENTNTTSGFSVGTLSSTDVDAGDTFTYSIVGGVDAGVFSIGGAGSDELILTDGVLDFETQPSYAVTVRTTDSGGLTVDQALIITVGDVNETPSFTSTAIIASTEDVAYSYSITTSDPDTGDALTITAPTLPAWLTLTDNGNGTATLAGTPTNTEVGPHTVSLQVSDGSLQDTQNFTVTVTNVNDAPVVDLDADDSVAAGVDFSTTWTEGSGPVLIADSDATLNDVDTANLTLLTVTLTNLPDSGNEFLTADTTGTLVVASYDTVSGVLTLSGSDTVANYQQVLRTVTYDNTFDHPNEAARTITFEAYDGTDTSNIGTTTLTVVGTHEAGVTITEIGTQGVGDQLTVNELPANGIATYLTQAVAVAPDGTAIVVWTSDAGQDGDNDSIMGRLIDAQGNSIGAEFVVNSTGTGAQSYASVAVDDSGNFVVAWTSDNQDGDSEGIYAQRFNNSGVAQGGEFLVNTTTAGSQAYSSIAMADSGEFVIAWTGNGVGDTAGVFAQRFDTNGVAQGGEFRINETTVDTQNHVEIASDENGNFVATWSSQNQDGSGRGVYMHRFDSDGNSLGGEQLVNTFTTGSQWLSSVAMNDSGEFVVGWRDDGQTGGIYIQMYNHDGTTNGGPIEVPSSPEAAANYPQVAMDDAGNVTVVWQDFEDANDYAIVARQFDSSGTPLGAQFLVNTHEQWYQEYPAISMNGDGQFVVVFTDYDANDDAEYSVEMRRFGGVTTEAGGTTNFSFVLDTQPTDDVTITLSMPDGTEGTLSTTNLTFTNADWNVAQVVTVTGVEDTLADGNVTHLLVTSAASSTDSNYSGLEVRDLNVTNLDNDPALDLDADNSAAVGIDYVETWTENGGPVGVVDADATLIDPDGNTLASVTVTLTNVLDGVDEVLEVDTTGTSIVANYNLGTGVLLLSGSHSVEDYQQVLRTVTYNNASEDPDLTSRVITFVASDGSNVSPMATTTVNIMAVNDAPVITSDGGASTASVNVTENQTAVTTVVATDVDTGDVPTFTISGGVDAALFGVDLNSGVLTFNTAPDFETFTDANTDGVYEVEVTADDGNSGTDVQLISITVTNVNEIPTLVSLSNSAVVENTDTSGGLSVGTLTSNDADAGETFTYSVVGGVDAGVFSIGGAGTDELILTDGVLDFESQPSYTVTIRTTDSGGLTYDQALVITVTDVNETPSFSSTAILTSTEDVAYSYSITTSDPDTGDTLTITAPTLPTWLTLTDNGNGTATLAGTPSNAEVGPHNVSLQISDGSLQDTQNFTITVTNINDAPVIISDGGAATASVNAAENQTAVTTVVATDVDTGDVPTFTISGGVDAALFGVDLNSGVLTFNTAPDFETFTDANTDGVYEVEITADDGNSGIDIQLISVTVTDVNEVPTLVSLSNSAVIENTDTSGGLSVGTLTSIDVDAGETFTYSVVGGVDASVFNIGGAGSDELILTDGVLDFESQPSYAVIIRTTDSGGLTYDQALVITVTDANETPSFSSTAILASTEDVAYSYSIATTDPDTGNSLTITAPTLPTWLTLTDNGDGTATLAGTPTNAEVGPHSVSLQVSDGSLQDTQNFTITVTNVNDAPVITSDGGAATASVNAAENQTAVTTVAASDADSGDVPTFTISGGSDAALFGVNLNSGVLTFNIRPDFEASTDANTDGVYEVEITADDGNSGTDAQLISVTVTDANDAPVITSDGGAAIASLTVAENQVAVTTVTASDADPNDVIVFLITGGDDAGHFQIDSATGALSFTAVQGFDNPSDNDGNGQYEVEVSASDLDGLMDTQHIAVVITSVPDLNAAISIEPTNLPPNVVPQIVPTISGSDAVEQNEPEEVEVESKPDAASVSQSNTEPESAGLSFPVNSLPLEFQIDSVTSLEEVVDAPPAKSESTKEPENRLAKYLRIWISGISESAKAFQDELDRQRFFDELSKQMDDYDEQAEAEAHKKKLVAQVTAGLSITLTAGFVSWILRAGSMVASLLTSMPAWRQLDLLPILSRREDEDFADTPNDDDVDDEDRQDDDPDHGVDSLLRKSG